MELGADLRVPGDFGAYPAEFGGFLAHLPD